MNEFANANMIYVICVVFMQGLQVPELMEQLLSHIWTLAVPAVGHLTCRITLRPYPSHHTAHPTPQTVLGGCSAIMNVFFMHYLMM
jgi:hypothetical protein